MLIGEVISKNEELILSLKDSLWYAVIMRIAKICEDDTQVNSIYKVFNCCSSNPIIARQRIISENEIIKMKLKIDSAIKDESGENINLIKSWRDKYLAHYSKLVDPKTTQKAFLITNKRLDYIIDTLLEILETLNQRFKININDTVASKKIEILKLQFNFIYDKMESFYEQI